MAKRFEKMNTDKKEIEKEEKKVKIGKAIVVALGAAAGAFISIIIKGKSGGTKA